MSSQHIPTATFASIVFTLTFACLSSFYLQPRLQFKCEIQSKQYVVKCFHLDY